MTNEEREPMYIEATSGGSVWLDEQGVRHPYISNNEAFRRMLRERGLLPSELREKEEEQWAVDHPGYRDEVRQKESFLLSISDKVQAGVPREEIGRLWKQAQTSFDRELQRRARVLRDQIFRRK